MNSISVLSAAFAMGFLGSLHCAGMCGPLMLMLPFHRLDGWRRWLAFGWYHSGRISMYAVMGLLLHSFSGFFQPAWQRYVSLILGGLLLLGGILTFFVSFSGWRLPQSAWLRQQAGRLLGHTDGGSLLAAGLLNGLLPCGLVYMGLSAATAAPSAGLAVATMYAFGLGTLPMLISIAILRKRLPFLQAPALKKGVPMLLFLCGSLLIVRGMNLGIPYLSPGITVARQHISVSGCCHKP